ncbi:sulfotransferase family 2 domain-containing protein [Aliiglaciecola sp. 3_MG-2023]|uniref:sulfotransferase family 2 domain-containing protein n=1 Tax=Aliiglaciecola sp. 3_MG-2023 TaxID=3062644 RepID=UPI0026E12B14|nr:sulfotransferase family 2 domain-containing protein [Aliiglaciecola sp. 3_MG-2023]MDO6692470.1 sulfotransferase family 2 domain-containing protein [Aliiglaciecola sp. 3_MG-2023]
MLISHQYNFIFIHIYKTAGTSIMNEFVPHSRLIDRLAYQNTLSRLIFGQINNLMGWSDDGMKQFTGHHKHAKAHEVEDKMGTKAFSSYYKFSFVRNPFDLIVSKYFYILQSKKHVSHKKVLNMSFLDFLKWHLSKKPPLQIDFLMNQHRDRKLVDYIGRFENLTEDTSKIKKNLGLEVSNGIEHRNPSLNRKSKNYQDYYDDESKSLVSNYFQLDLELLGYNYDGAQGDMKLITQY